MKRKRTPIVSNEIASIHNRIVKRVQSGEGVWGETPDGRMIIGFDVANLRYTAKQEAAWPE